jgi:hypothetical protein
MGPQRYPACILDAPMRPPFRSLLFACAWSLLFVLFVPLVSGGCSKTTYTAPDRVAGVRAPRTAACDDDVDPTGCLLPWPSSTFTRLDPTSPTGVRVAVKLDSLGADDDPASLNRADGFSRLSPLVTGFDTPLDPPSEEAIQLYLAEPGRPHTGEAVALRVQQYPSKDEPSRALLVATPRRVLEPNAEYVVIVTSALHAEGGKAIAGERSARVALGLDDPESQAEADLRGHHAPARALLAKAGVDPNRVLRIWDFTTRSTEDGTRRLRAMRDAARAAVTGGKTQVTIDVVTAGTGSAALVVEGHLAGLPSFASKTGLTLDDKGLPIADGTRQAPVRVEIPKGAGDYPFIMYGHGTGGNFHDSAFDEELASTGIAKVGISFYGWTDDEVLPTFFGLKHMISASAGSTAWLMQAVADGAAIQAAMPGAIADALSAPMLGGAANPVAGRKPDGKVAIWAGGSLGGTMGLVFTCASPEVRAAVLNVPGAGWTHFISESSLYSTIEPFVVGPYGNDIGLLQAMFMSQTNWDDVDGGIWKEALAGRKTTFLLQESIGDQVLPNIGSENVALTTSAVQLGKVLVPIAGVSPANEAIDASALTQYHVTAATALDVHGFAAKDTPAGAAAREQIRAFVATVLAGAPRITVPAGCTGGSCDFSQ